MTAEEQAVSFHHKRVGQRAAIVAGGPVSNFLFAILLLSVLYMTVGQPYTLPSVESVQPDSAAAEAGLQPGDLVKSVDGAPIARFQDLQRIIQANPGQRLSMVIAPAGSVTTVAVTPKVNEFTHHFGNHQRIGLLRVNSSH